MTEAINGYHKLIPLADNSQVSINIAPVIPAHISATANLVAALSSTEEGELILGRKLTALFADSKEWSNNTFGEGRHPNGPLKHLAKEVEETLAMPYDRMEYADMFLLLLDAWRNAGNPIEDLITVAQDKLNINKQRTWGPLDADGISMHRKD